MNKKKPKCTLFKLNGIKIKTLHIIYLHEKEKAIFASELVKLKQKTFTQIHG